MSKIIAAALELYNIYSHAQHTCTIGVIEWVMGGVQSMHGDLIERRTFARTFWCFIVRRTPIHILRFVSFYNKTNIISPNSIQITCRLLNYIVKEN